MLPSSTSPTGEANWTMEDLDEHVRALHHCQYVVSIRQIFFSFYVFQRTHRL